MIFPAAASFSRYCLSSSCASRSSASCLSACRARGEEVALASPAPLPTPPSRHLPPPPACARSHCRAGPPRERALEGAPPTAGRLHTTRQGSWGGGGEMRGEG